MDTDADTVGDVVARERRSDRPAIRALPSEREQSYREFCTTAYKAGNFLRYLGVGPGDRVAVADDHRLEPVLTFFGAALGGAVTRFGDPTTAAVDGAVEGDSAGRLRAVVAGREREADLDLPPGRRLAVYGGAPADPSTAHWERDVWSENPAFPPTDVGADDPVLAALDRVDGDETVHAHADLLAAAEDAVAALDLAPADAVALRAPLSEPRAVAAGLLAPLLAGATAVLVGEGGDSAVTRRSDLRGERADAEATVAVVAEGARGAPEPRRFSVADVDL